MPHLFYPSPTGRNRYYAWFGALHTRVDLLFYAPYPEAKFLEVEEAVRQRLAEIEQMGNRFDPQSELSQAVRQAHERPVPLSPELFALLTRCREGRLQTGGLFDITVNSPAFKPGLAQSVELKADGCLRLHTADVVLDLSGILKGYALEQLRILLTTKGITDAVVNLGNSSIMAMGAKSGCDGWPVGERFGEQCFETSLHNECLTTSGNIDGVNHHIINPLTNKEIGMNRKASVVTRSATEGEVLSTAYLIADDEQRARLDSIFQPRCVVIDGEVHYNL